MDYKARFYSAYLTRFLQPDTLIPSLANPQSWNRYSYVGNSPVNFSDPTGHMLWEGEGVNITSQTIIDDKRKEREFRQRTEYFACMRGHDEHCSPVDKLDRWMWENLPSAISIHGGWAGQIGFAGEFGKFVESEYVINWRSLEIDRFVTTGHTGYIGTPTIAQGSHYKGISFIYGASSNKVLEGPSSFGGFTRGLSDAINIVVVYQRSDATRSSEIRVIDTASHRPIVSHQLSLSAGISPLPGVQTGGFIGEADSTRIREGDLGSSILWSLYFQ